jgi:hypothetical protein
MVTAALYERPVAMSCSRLEALAEANDQFHWGTKVDEIKCAARSLHDLNLNPTLVEKLELKIEIMRSVEGLATPYFGMLTVVHSEVSR